MAITRATFPLAILAVFIPFFNAGCNILKIQDLSGHIVKNSFHIIVSLCIIDIFFHFSF